MHVYAHITYIYIYTYIERERARTTARVLGEKPMHVYVHITYVYMYTHIYIYIYIYILIYIYKFIYTYIHTYIDIAPCRARTPARVLGENWPLHDIAMHNIVWCMAYKRRVGGGAYIAQ